uniref:cdc42-interacting protein 4 homolog n=1 Tax=Oncorhynchus gorbuscha TaxID=8017 RepID=UPI001EAEFC26
QIPSGPQTRTQNIPGRCQKAQQNLEISFKQLENTKRRFAKEWGEAEKATQQAEKIENDTNAVKADVEKVKQHAHVKTHTAEECRNDYAAQLQKYNKEQNTFYYTEIPQLFNVTHFTYVVCV